MRFISAEVDPGRTKLEHLPEQRELGRLEFYSAGPCQIFAQPFQGDEGIWAISGATLQADGSLVVMIGAAEYWVDVGSRTQIAYRWVEEKR